MGIPRRYKTYVCWVLCVSAALILTACPNTNYEKSLTQIRSQISVLSNEMRESFVNSEEDRIGLYKKLNDDIKVLQKSQADSSATNDELRASLAAIDGKLDEYNARMQKLSERLSLVETALTERIGFLSDQVNEIEQETTINPGPPPGQRRPPTPETPSLETTPSPEAPSIQQNGDTEASRIYHTAYTAYVNGDFDTAIAGFGKYLELYPDTELADIAQYWIAESFFSLGEFETALEEYDTLINQYTDSDKIPAAYLSKADAYLKLDRQLEAISHLKHIMNQFPNSNAAQKAEERLRALGEY